MGCYTPVVPPSFPPLVIQTPTLRVPPSFAPLPIVHPPVAPYAAPTSLVTPHVARLQVYTHQTTSAASEQPTPSSSLMTLSSVGLSNSCFTASVPLHYLYVSLLASCTRQGPSVCQQSFPPSLAIGPLSTLLWWLIRSSTCTRWSLIAPLASSSSSTNWF
jgi:hypothetical protein